MDKSDILKKLGSFSIGPIVGAFINFITTPLITYFISPDEYGRASMFTVALSIIQLVVFLGMDQAYVKRYYESSNQSSLFINALIPSVVLIIIFECISALLVEKIGKWLYDSETERVCVYALMAIIPALAMERFLLLSIRMAQRGKLYSVMSILSKTLILIATVIFFLVYEKSFRSVVLGNTFAQIIYAVILCVVQRHEIKLDLSFINYIEIHNLLKFGLPLIPTTIIGWILTGMDKIMLRSLGTYEELGLYGVASRVAAVLTIVQACFTSFWSPLAFQWHSEGADNKRFVKVGNIVSCVMSIAFAVILLCKDLVFFLFGQSYGDSAAILPFLLFTPIMYTISEVTVMGIYFNDKTIWTVVVSCVSASINLILNWILIPNYGPMGAAIATGFSYISFFWTRTLLSRRIWFDFPLLKYIIMTIILVIDAFITTFGNGIIMYCGNVICVCILLCLYFAEVKDLSITAIDIIKRIYIQKLKKGS